MRRERAILGVPGAEAGSDLSRPGLSGRRLELSMQKKHMLAYPIGIFYCVVPPRHKRTSGDTHSVSSTSPYFFGATDARRDPALRPRDAAARARPIQHWQVTAPEDLS